MKRIKTIHFFFVPDSRLVRHLCLRRSVGYPAVGPGWMSSSSFIFLVLLLAGFFEIFPAVAQPVRTDISLDKGWQSFAVDSLEPGSAPFQIGSKTKQEWTTVDVPHNWDAYEGYRRLRHGNRHGYAYYRKSFVLPPQPKGKRVFLFFEGVGSYATVWLNGKKVGHHAGGRTSFTLDVTTAVFPKQLNQLYVRADHPAFIRDLPWVCGGCSDDRGFSEGSQPMGIFRPVHLLLTNEVRVTPFGVHLWNDTTASKASANLFYETEIKNFGSVLKKIRVANRLVDHRGSVISETKSWQNLAAGETVVVKQRPPFIANPRLWSLEDPYQYILVTEIWEAGKLVDRVETPYGIRTIQWPVYHPSSKQFLLNGKPVFINGIAEYEHLLGSSHAFSAEQVRSRVMQVKAAGFNAFRDAHQPHNLRYQQYWDSLGLLLWTQLSAHDWYDTRAFRDNFKTLLAEWVKERRNSPSVVLWGLQNESKLPEDFARECTELIRSLDPTASSQRLVTTCNGGSGTDWDVPQNWTGTYGGNPATYGEDLKRQLLVGEYGAWRTLDLHTEGAFQQNGVYSEDRMVQLMETKIRLANDVSDSTTGHFMWLLTSHDNPGRVQGGEGFRELDRIGPVNYKGLLTPWEEPTDAFYLYRANFAPKEKEPMVYLVSHTWPDRWTGPGQKNGIVVYSNCDEVELFNEAGGPSLGRKKKGGIGTHFQWDDVTIRYNLLYAVGYVNGLKVAEDRVVLHHLPQAPNLEKAFPVTGIDTRPEPGFRYLYRVNCGGPSYRDTNGNTWLADRARIGNKTWGSTSWTAAFAGLPPLFASQRTITNPIAGTADSPLFQSFRYGRNSLQYDFPLADGDYRLELYFTEPWWGTGGGLNAKGLRLFDVAVNGKTILRDLDIWQESGTANALKKSVTVQVKGGALSLSFPRVAAGQAVLSAIAIATKNGAVTAAPSPQPILQTVNKANGHPFEEKDWLSTGDAPFAGEPVAISFLSPELYGTQWIRQKRGAPEVTLRTSQEADVFMAIDSSEGVKPVWLQNFERTPGRLELADGSVYAVWKKRMTTGETFTVRSPSGLVVMANPATRMEPAFDLKPVNSYKAVAANLSGPGLARTTVDGKERVLFREASKANAVAWTIQVGVGDIYSLQLSYNNPGSVTVQGRLQLRSADGTTMKEEVVALTPTRPGKSNFINTTTGSMINAGSYQVIFTAEDAAGITLNALDVQ